ncbi:MAG TPA: DUF4190 domain-containing protein [Ktedonobacteraceae bacterium]
MSSPYEGNNPYVPPTQYPSQPGYYPPDQPPQYGYPQPAPQPVYMSPQYIGVPVVPINEPGYNAALVGMILGIIGVFVWITSIPGLIVSIFGLKSTTRKGMAIAGLITSIIGIVFMVAYIAFFIIIAVAASNSTPTYP